MANTARVGMGRQVVGALAAAIVGVAAGGSQAGAQVAGTAAPLDLVSSGIYYSAFDGARDYRVQLGITKYDPNAADPIDLASVKWSFDGAAVKAEPAPDVPAGVLLTTKRAGNTPVKVEAKTKSGKPLTDDIMLVISKAEHWELGDATYKDKEASWPRLPLPESCGKLLSGEIESACLSCHGQGSTLRVPLSTQISTLSDEALVALIAEGTISQDYVDAAPFLRNLPFETKQCAFRSFHGWELSDEVKLGLLFKVRSEVPEKAPVKP